MAPTIPHMPAIVSKTVFSAWGPGEIGGMLLAHVATRAGEETCNRTHLPFAPGPGKVLSECGIFGAWRSRAPRRARRRRGGGDAGGLGNRDVRPRAREEDRADPSTSDEEAGASAIVLRIGSPAARGGSPRAGGASRGRDRRRGLRCTTTPGESRSTAPIREVHGTEAVTSAGLARRPGEAPNIRRAPHDLPTHSAAAGRA
jgi:hypothetical protein